MTKKENFEELLTMLDEQSDVQMLRDMARTTLIARELTLSAINDAYRGMLSTASPEALVHIEAFHRAIQAQIALNNLQLVARLLGNAEGEGLF